MGREQVKANMRLAGRIKPIRRTGQVARPRPSQPFQGMEQSPSQVFGNSNSNNGVQQQQNPFGFSSQSQSFGGTQASNAGQAASASASFPPFSSIAPPDTSFTFAANSNVSYNNPFENTASNSNQTNQRGGFQGSIFSIPANQAVGPEKEREAKAKKQGDIYLDDSAPMWANGVNPFDATNNPASGSQEQPQSKPNGLENSSSSLSASQDQQPGNVFGKIDDSNKASEPSFPNLFGTSQPSQKTYNPFSAAKFPQSTSSQAAPNASASTSSIFTSAPSQQATTNIFGKLDAQKDAKGQPNVFGTSQPSNVNTSSLSQPTSNIFGQSQPQQNQPLSNIFGQSNSNHHKTQPAISPTENSPDRMSTTPDSSPSAVQQGVAAKFAALNPPASPSPQGNTSNTGVTLETSSQPPQLHATSAGQGGDNKLPGQGGSLFNRISRPIGQDQGTNLFGSVSRPSESSGQNSNASSEPASGSPEKNTNVFGGFGQVSKGVSESTSSATEKPKNFFGGFGQPSANTSKSDSDSAATSANGASQGPFSTNWKPPGSTTPAINSTQSFSSSTRPLTNEFSGFGQHPSKSTFNSHDPDNKLPDNASELFTGSKQASSTASPNKFQGPALPTTPATNSAGSIFDIQNMAPQGGNSAKRNVSGSKSGRPRIKALPRSKRRPGAAPTPPPEFGEDEKQQCITGYQLKAFDAGFKSSFDFRSDDDVQAAVTYYQSRRETIVKPEDPSITDTADSSKRKVPPAEDSESSPSKKARLEMTSTSTATPAQTRGSELSNGHVSLTQNPFTSQLSATKQLLPGKRNSDEILTTEDPTGASDSAKRMRGDSYASPSSSSTLNSSQTANIFKSIVDDTEERPAPTFETASPISQSSSAPAKVPTANMSSPVKPFIPALSKGNVFGNTTSPAKPTIKPPTFGSVAPASFLTQFQQKSKDEEQKKKEEAKAQDLDSDEDEDEWERQYEKDQGAKKQKLAGLAKGARFVPGKGFQSSEDETEKAVPKELVLNEDPSDPLSRASSVSVLEQPLQPLPNGVTNIFAHLSPAGSGAEDSKTGDADDEDTGSEDNQDDDGHRLASEDPRTDEAPSTQPQPTGNLFSPFSVMAGSKEVRPPANEKPASRSLFDRIEKDKDGNPVREIPPAEEEKASSPFSIFATGNSSGSFPNFSPSSQSPSADHTWKTDSPIKFGGIKSQPDLLVTSRGSPKPIVGGLFGKTSPPATSKVPTAPAFSLFQTSIVPKTPEVGFGIPIAKPTDSLAPSDAATKDSSRATSPGASSNAGTVSESGADAKDKEDELRDEQVDLTLGGPGEEDEVTLFEVKGKALKLDAANKVWSTEGVGPVRVLKHSESGKTRIIMRQHPSGKVILNAALLSGINYRYTDKKPKAVEVPFATDSGKLASFTLTVGKAEDASKLASILEENKRF